MGSPGVGELLIVLAIILVLFGAKKLPDLASSMGKSIREFRKATDETDADTDQPASTADDREA